MKRKKIRKFCRLYKYTCKSCLKIKHRRHYTKDGHTICPVCLKRDELFLAQASLF